MFELDTLSTLVAATLVLLLGRKLVQSVSLLKKYTISGAGGRGVTGRGCSACAEKKASVGKSTLI